MELIPVTLLPMLCSNKYSQPKTLESIVGCGLEKRRDKGDCKRIKRAERERDPTRKRFESEREIDLAKEEGSSSLRQQEAVEFVVESSKN